MSRTRNTREASRRQARRRVRNVQVPLAAESVFGVWLPVASRPATVLADHDEHCPTATVSPSATKIRATCSPRARDLDRLSCPSDLDEGVVPPFDLLALGDEPAGGSRLWSAPAEIRQFEPVRHRANSAAEASLASAECRCRLALPGTPAQPRRAWAAGARSRARRAAGTISNVKATFGRARSRFGLACPRRARLWSPRYVAIWSVRSGSRCTALGSWFGSSVPRTSAWRGPVERRVVDVPRPEVLTPRER